MPAHVREGEVFAGKYRVEHILGEGGHGVVFAARNIELGERVAVKLLKSVADDPVSAERFLREARAAQKIRGDGIARVHAVDRLEDGDLFMVMEYLEGQDLRQEIIKSGPLAVGDAVDCILQVCEVLGRAHAMGIIHRDIKSANLFSVKRADGRRQIKVLDFGIARSLDPVDESLTQTPQMMGSPLYMAPEQILDGRSVDERTDIWGLGATLFELLTGTPPFAGKTIVQVLMRVQSHPPDSIRGLRPEVPAGLERAIERCLEKDRERRFPDVGSLSAALAPFSRAGDRTQPSSPSSDLASSSSPAVLQVPVGGTTAPVEPPTIAQFRPSSEPPMRRSAPSFHPHENGFAATVISGQGLPYQSSPPPQVSSAPPPPRTSVMPAPVPMPVPPNAPTPASGLSSTPILIAVGAMVVVLVVIAVIAKARHRGSDGAEGEGASASSGEMVPTAVPMPPPFGGTVATTTAVAIASTVPAAVDPPPSARASAEPPVAQPRIRGTHTRPPNTGKSATTAPPAGGTPTPLPDDRQ